MSARLESFHVWDLFENVYRHEVERQARVEDMTVDERVEYAEEACKRATLFDAFASHVARIAGLALDDVTACIHRAAHGRNWGPWRRQGRGDDWPDLREAANGIAAYYRESALDDLIAWMRTEYPKEANDVLGPLPTSPSVRDGDEFRPADWFTRNTRVKAPRLRQATSPKRKGRTVRSRVIDGVKCYSVTDARRNWPDDMSSTA